MKSMEIGEEVMLVIPHFIAGFAENWEPLGLVNTVASLAFGAKKFIGLTRIINTREI